MAYDIANIIYGAPITAAVWEALDAIRLADEREDERLSREDRALVLGFTQLYSGSANEPPGYIGEFRLSSNTFDGPARLDALPPLAKKSAAAVRAKINSLPEQVRAVLPPIGTYLVWSTS